MESVGTRLRNARLAKSLSIEDVYKKTKIHPNILSALEEDRFSTLNPVYVRSFLKQYAGFLGLNPQELVPGLQPPKMKADVRPVEDVSAADKPSAPVRPNVPLVAKPAVAPKPAAAEKPVPPKSLFENEQAVATPATHEQKQGSKKIQPPVKHAESSATPEPLEEKEPAKSAPIITAEQATFYLKFAGVALGIILALWVTFKTIRFVVVQTKRAVAAMAAKRKDAKAAQKTAAVAPKAKTIAQQGKNIISSKSANQFASLSIRAKEDSWIQLKTDGRTAFQGVLKRGYSESWTANEKMDLSVGNAGGVEISVNGNSIPPLGKRKQSIKGIVITKEGLTIPR